jgi:hypothetical protein
MKDERSGILSGWKEIANYLGQAVRTVQRYEYELGLPVHRPAGKLRGAVMAATSDLDAWVAASPARDVPVLSDFKSELFVLLDELRTNVAEFKRLREETAESRQALAKSRKVLRDSLATTVSDSTAAPLALGSRTRSLRQRSDGHA